MQRTYPGKIRTGYTVLVILFFSVNTVFAPVSPLRIASEERAEKNSPGLYQELQLAGLGLSKPAFDKAIIGFQNLKKLRQLRKDALLSVADMSQSSNARRLYVINLADTSVLFNTYVSHGKNTGGEYAKSFGNKPESYKSSLGFYVTGSSYNGRHGLSLRLKGVEKDINHRAEQRGIVIHGADYVSEAFIEKYGRLGRSHGCPAVPSSQCDDIVNTIREGSCFFVYYPDSSYFRRSPVFNL